MKSKSQKTKNKTIKDMVTDIRSNVDNRGLENSEDQVSDSIQIDKKEFKKQYFHKNYMEKEVFKVKLDLKQMEKHESTLPKKLLVNKRFISNHIRDAGNYVPLKR